MSKYLFICSANKDRSRTAEDMFSENHPEHSFDSAGTNAKICMQLGTTFAEKEQLEWADKIICMEQKHKSFLRKEFGSIFNSKIEVLNIADRYEYNQKELKLIIAEKITL